MQDFSFLCHDCQKKIVTKSEHLSLLALKAAESLTKNITDAVCQNLDFLVFFSNILKLKISFLMSIPISASLKVFISMFEYTMLNAVVTRVSPCLRSVGD